MDGGSLACNGMSHKQRTTLQLYQVELHDSNFLEALRLRVEYGIVMDFVEETDGGFRNKRNHFVWMEDVNGGDVLLNRIWVVEGGMSTYLKGAGGTPIILERNSYL